MTLGLKVKAPPGLRSDDRPIPLKLFLKDLGGDTQQNQTVADPNSSVSVHIGL
jgi:hypothetical protein